MTDFCSFLTQLHFSAGCEDPIKRSRATLMRQQSRLEIIHATGVSRSGWGVSCLLCMNRVLEVSGCCLEISCQPRRQRRAEGGGDAERDGREQLRDEQLRSPEMFGPYFSREKQFGRCRGVEMDSTERRRNVFSDNETDAVSRSKIIPVQTKPSWPGARFRQGKC